MLGRRLEKDIRALKDFLEFWEKFHAEYKQLTLREIITPEDEARLFESRDIIRKKYTELKSALEFNFVPHQRLTDPVSDVLAMSNIRFISEQNLKKLTDNWQYSFIFLNSILERHEHRKRRLGQLNPIGVFFKYLFRR